MPWINSNDRLPDYGETVPVRRDVGGRTAVGYRDMTDERGENWEVWAKGDQRRTVQNVPWWYELED